MRILYTLLFLVLAVSITTGQHQDTLKARPKAISVELNINPLEGSLSFNNALQQIKIRYFKTNDVAYRIAFNGSLKQFHNTAPVDNIQKTGTFGVNVGLEKHMKGTRRLSPYIGAELSLFAKWSKENLNGWRVIDGGWITDPYSNTAYTELGYFRYGVNLISGFDYYPAKNFYFGYEFAFQIYQKNYTDVQDSSGSTNYGSYKGGSEFYVGPNLINGIRLGYIF